MPPTVAIIERHRELAIALEEVVTLARCTPVTMADVSELAQLADPPAAIVVRVAASLAANSPHAALGQLSRAERPTVLALASNDSDVAEAERLGCDVVLREPQQVRALYDALSDVAARACATGRRR